MRRALSVAETPSMRATLDWARVDAPNGSQMDARNAHRKDETLGAASAARCFLDCTVSSLAALGPLGADGCARHWPASPLPAGAFSFKWNHWVMSNFGRQVRAGRARAHNGRAAGRCVRLAGAQPTRSVLFALVAPPVAEQSGAQWAPTSRAVAGATPRSAR